jgi:hypothetical protein
MSSQAMQDRKRFSPSVTLWLGALNIVPENPLLQHASVGRKLAREHVCSGGWLTHGGAHPAQHAGIPSRISWNSGEEGKARRGSLLGHVEHNQAPDERSSKIVLCTAMDWGQCPRYMLCLVDGVHLPTCCQHIQETRGHRFYHDNSETKGSMESIQLDSGSLKYMLARTISGHFQRRSWACQQGEKGAVRRRPRCGHLSPASLHSPGRDAAL